MPSPPENAIVIFCDGACSGNPGPGGWGAVVLTPGGAVQELGGRHPRTTNNQMELTAAIEALRFVERASGEVALYTDSSYVIKGITQWIWNWRRKGWLSSEGKEVANRELWEQLFAVSSARRKPNHVTWNYVPGHSDVPGNERVDAIAVAFSKGIPLLLYEGSFDDYGVDLRQLPEEGAAPKAKSKSRSGGSKAYSYLSLLGNVATRHRDWAACERRVRGQSNAKFKKAMSADDEITILRSWGVDPKSVVEG